jgi:hypothetical protein
MDRTCTPAITNEDEVSIEWLQRLFQRAFFTTEIDSDGDLYITEGLEFPIWATLLEEQKLIRFFTFLRHSSKEHGPITKTGVNYLNATVLLASFHVRKNETDKLHSAYVLSYAHCVVDAHVVGAARRFAGASLYGAHQLHDFALH